MESEKEKLEVLQPYEIYRFTLEHYIDCAGSRVRLEEPLTIQMAIDNSLMPCHAYLNRMLDTTRKEVLRMVGNNGCLRNEEGSRVALIRRLRDMSQRDVAKKIGVTQGYLSDIELGRCPLDQVIANRLGTTLNVSVDYLMKGGELQIKMF